MKEYTAPRFPAAPRPTRAAVLGLAAVGAASVLPLHAQTASRLVVGIAAIDGSIGPLVGLRAGIFKRHGLDVELAVMNSGAALSAAVIGGSIAVAATNVVGLISAHAKGVPLQIVAPAGIYRSEKPAEALVVRRDSPIASGADFSGKTIASSALGDLDSLACLAWIDAHGGNSDLVRRVELPPAATAAALVAGRVDGAALQEPRLSEALQAGQVRVLGDEYAAVARRFIVSAMVAAGEAATANRDVMMRYARAQLEANVYANAHHDETARWLAELANVDVESIARAPRKEFAESLDLALIRPLVDVTLRYKVITRAFDPRELISPAVASLLS